LGGLATHPVLAGIIAATLPLRIGRSF